MFSHSQYSERSLVITAVFRVLTAGVSGPPTSCLRRLCCGSRTGSRWMCGAAACCSTSSCQAPCPSSAPRTGGSLPVVYCPATVRWCRLYEAVCEGKLYLNSARWQYVSDHAKDLVRQMLTASAEERLTVEEALNHRCGDQHYIRAANGA